MWLYNNVKCYGELAYCMRKRIAVLIAQIDESTQKKFLTGFITKAYEYDYDVCIFSMYQKYQETDKRNVGDSNIYNLINYALFDAVIFLGDMILSPGVSPRVHEEIHQKFNGPVLCIDQESSYFDYVMMDHYTPVHSIVDHMIEVHGYKDIAFLGGKEGHPHSVQRLNAFLDSMKEHDVEVKDKWIYHGNYWYDGAERFVDYLLGLDELPRAIVCANDISAIGAATLLSERGFRIPEDIAITGYDSVEAGTTSPKPLTSANIPSHDCGEYAANWVFAKLNNKEIGPFKCNPDLFIGSSCGCAYEVEMVPKQIRTQWRTQQSAKSMFSDFNHMLEDLMSQDRLSQFLKMIQEYTYQIKPFTTFDICLNEGFLSPDSFIGDNALRSGYTKAMHCVLSCTEDKGTVDYRRRFATTDLIPQLNEDRPYPTTFIFNPLYSDDRCFGYTVLNYADQVRIYESSFRMWMRDIMQGFEAFYRQGYMLELIEKVKADQVRDTLTGLYNYAGFLKNTEDILLSVKEGNQKVGILAIDIKGIHQINEVYGRETGEKAIYTVAHFIQNSIGEDEICCRMSNDEFLVFSFTEDSEDKLKAILEEVEKKVHGHRLVEGSDYKFRIHSSVLIGENSEMVELEALINQAVSIKNHKKNAATKSATPNRDVMDELKCNQIVMNILNKNLLTYHYQPIVNAHDGSIYAYEALMRSKTGDVSPFQIIKSATYLNRLNDVERFTLLNVTSEVTQNPEQFGSAKIFINSLPGIEIPEADEREFEARLVENDGRFVIEFTEESELDDKQLDSMKHKYERYGCRIAVDDFGAGYSNVNNLLRYMPQYVKIDRMLIMKIQNNPQKQHFVRSIIDFAHDNGIYALAEGVETGDELMECLKLGVDLIQGYYTGRPQREPISEIDPVIKSQIEEFRSQNIDWRAV